MGFVTRYLSDLSCEPPPLWASGSLSPLHRLESKSRVRESDALIPAEELLCPALLEAAAPRGAP